MTARQQRRAQERLARKKGDRLAAKPNDLSSRTLAPQNPLTPHPQIAGTPDPHFARTPAARQTHKTNDPPTHPQPEPPTANTYAHYAAIAGTALLLPSEDPAQYRAHLLHYFEQHSPAPGAESFIVQRLADLQWRLRRIATLEAGIMALGRRKYADLFTESDLAARIALLDAHTLGAEAFVLKQIHLQESRLRRYYLTDLKELTAIQERRQAPQAETTVPESRTRVAVPDVRAINAHPIDAHPPDLDDDGFEFASAISLDLSNDLEPADCLEVMLGPDFANHAICAGTTADSARP